MKSNEDKQKVIGKHLVMACSSKVSLISPTRRLTRPLYTPSQTLENQATLSSLPSTSSATSASTKFGAFSGRLASEPF